MRLLRTGLLILLALTARAETVLRIEGEDRAREGGPGRLRVIEREGAFGGQVLSYWDDHGTWAEWEIEVPAAGVYALSFRYAAVADTDRRLEIDGRVPAGLPGSIRFPPTGGYGLFDMHTLADGEGRPRLFELAEGRHTLRLTNVESIGLALDAILLHAPGLRFTDQPLPPAEAADWQSRLLSAAAAPVVAPDRLAKGMVAATFAADGVVSLAVADTLFSLAGERAETAVFQTRHLLVHRTVLASGRRYVLTDGQAAYVVVVPGGGFGLSPQTYRSEGRLLHPATWRLGDGRVFIPALGIAGEASADWRLGAAQISAVPALFPENGALRFAEAGRVAALKLAPASWRESGMQLELARDGNVDVLRSSAQILPGIAAFYDYADFEIRFSWEGDRLVACELTDLASGERLSLL